MSEQQAQQQQEPLAEPITKGPEGGGLFPAPKKGFWGKVDEWFGITRSGSRYRTEIVAGVTTFMAMVYILMVNAGMFQGVITDSADPYGAAYIATALGAIVGTLLMAFLARMPLAQASGMGINAFIVYTLILGGTGLTYANGKLVSVNGKSVKPAYQVKIGDIVTVGFAGDEVSFRVLSLNEKVSAKDAETLYEIV